MRTRIAGLLAGGLLMISASADEVIWDNYASGYVEQLWSSQLDTIYPFDSQVADDFMFVGTGQPWAITGVGWVGGFWGAAPPLGEPFNIYIYGDDGTGNAPTGGPDDPTDTALAIYEDLRPSESGLPEYWWYEYAVDLPGPFLAEPEVKYWIAIQWDHPFPPQWGIAESLDSWGATAKQGFPYLGVPYWEEDLQADMTFRLTGYQVPEPGCLALVGVAGLLLARRCRE